MFQCGAGLVFYFYISKGWFSFLYFYSIFLVLSCYTGVRRHVRQFLGAISCLVRVSLPWCFGVAEGCFQHRIQYNGKRLGKRYFYRVSEGALQSFLVRFRGLSVLPCHGVLVWRRAVFSTGFNTTGKGWENVIFYRVSEGAFQSFLVRFRGLSVLHCHSVLVSGFSVLHCHGVLVWRKAVFSTGFSTTGKGWEKATFWFRGLSVYHCNGVLVWRRAVFSTGVSTTGKGWEKVKKYFL